MKRTTKAKTLSAFSLEVGGRVVTASGFENGHIRWCVPYLGQLLERAARRSEMWQERTRIENLRIREAVPMGTRRKPRRFTVLGTTHDLSGRTVVTIIEERGNQ